MPIDTIMSRRSALQLLSAGAVGASVIPQFSIGARAQATVTLRLGEIYAESHSNSRGAKRFAELVAERTGGAVKVDVYTDSKIGNERELAEGVVAGTIDITPTGLAGIGRFVQPIHALELPYIYRDLDHLARVAQAVAPDLDGIFLAKGVKLIGSMALGPRNVASRRPVKSLAELRGLKLRVPESPLYVGMARALGATPTPVAFPEAYTSLQTGVVDAAEGDPTALFTAKWFEPAKFITETEHIWHVRYMVMNAGVFDRLTGPQKDAILSSARDAQTFQIGLHREANKEALAKMQAGGATIIPIEDRSPFINALATFNREYAEKNGKEALVLLEKAGAVK